MALRVSIVCQNAKQDRIIPRMARALHDAYGWTLSAKPDPKAEAVYLSAYFEATRIKPWPEVPVAAYFTHREEEPPGNSKAKYFDSLAKRVQLRVATCKKYALYLSEWGPTVQAAAPLERDRFVLKPRKRGKRPVVGLSGYTYNNHRKGEDLVRALLASSLAQKLEWRASGRGWPVKTARYSWADMPKFYQGLDVLLVPSRVEGIPMPPLEALACGIPVVIPRHVGLLDELPEVPGIYRFERGDPKGLLKALQKAAFPGKPINRKALRAATAPYSIEAWCQDVALGVERMLGARVDAGIDEAVITEEVEVPKIKASRPVQRNTKSKRGIYCVAFGDPARKCALRLMRSAKKHMPDIPIALCSDRKIGLEDVLIKQPDSDVGGRRAKLKAYELSPAEWKAVLYLDADTELVAPIHKYFEWIEAGWEFVITKDPHLMDTMHAFVRRNNRAELAEVKKKVKTLHTLQWNGGVWAFGRSKRIAAFFRRWQAEWERHAQRDQGALVRAMYAAPLRILLLGNQWNTFPKYTRGIETAGLMHYPGDARRWKGLLPGRIDSPAAWAAVKRHEGRRGGR